MSELSPAAQAVYNAYFSHWTADPYEVSPEALAAALRTTADQLFPEPDDWTKDNMSEQGIWLLRLKRDQLLAIADELEAQ